MSNSIEKDGHELINKINLILNDFENFEKPFVNDQGDIVIRNKISRKNKINLYTFIRHLFCLQKYNFK